MSFLRQNTTVFTEKIDIMITKKAMKGVALLKNYITKGDKKCNA